MTIYFYFLGLFLKLLPHGRGNQKGFELILVHFVADKLSMLAGLILGRSHDA
jgi:hypothetical protein